MSPEISDEMLDVNQIVMFGNAGPDVLKLSQIYDPDNDAFVLTEDEEVQYLEAEEGQPRPMKAYYTRSYADGVVRFTRVTNITEYSNPSLNQWYETKAGYNASIDGKYVPAVQSLVVVDYDTDAWEKRTILVVVAVDPVTLQPSLKPINVGVLQETDYRATSYGNDKLMLFMDSVNGHQRLVPDRKLMLYGTGNFVYKLLKANGEVFSTNINPEDAKGLNGDEYIRFTTKTNAYSVKLTPANISGYAGCSFTYTTSNGRTITIDSLPEKISEAEFNTLFGADTATNGIEGQVGLKRNFYANPCRARLGTYIADGEVVTIEVYEYSYYKYVSIRFDDNQTEEFLRRRSSLYLRDEKGEYYLVDPSATLDPERTYYYVVNLTDKEALAARGSLADDVKYAERMIMSASLTAREQKKFFYTETQSSKIIKRLEVDYPDKTAEGYFKLGVGSTVAKMLENVTISVIYDDGTRRVISTKDPNLKIYGDVDVNTTYAGSTYPLVFKLFPLGPNRDLTTQYREAGFISTTVTVLIANSDPDLAVRAISLIPVWNNDASAYQLRFATYLYTGEAPKITDHNGWTIIDPSLNPVPDPLDKVSHRVVLRQPSFKDDLGQITESVSPGSTFGKVQHATVTQYVTSNAGIPTTSAVFAQDISFSLQNMVTRTSDVKWLIGRGITGEQAYAAQELPYGSVAGGARPYIFYNPYPENQEEADKVSKDGPFRVSKAFQDTRAFLEYFYNRALKLPSIDGETQSKDTPTHFRVRGLTDGIWYRNLNSQKALEGIEYYDTDGNKVAILPGAPTSGLVTKVQEDVRYFALENEEYIELDDSEVQRRLGPPGTIIRNPETVYVRYEGEIASDYIAIGKDDDAAHLSYFNIPDAKTSTEEIGGTIPVITGTGGSTEIAGTVVVEFARKRAGSDNDYDHLYGVPVEVRYPFVPTQDTKYAYTGKKYYKWSNDSKRFITIDFTPNGPVTKEFQVYEKRSESVLTVTP